MRDPHVNSLKYKLLTGNEVSYENCLPIEYENDIFTLKLADGILLCNFKEHFASVDLAKVEIESLLRSWEIDVAIKYGRGELKFVFVDADIVDRSPPPPGTVLISAISASATMSASTSCSATIHVERGKYPSIPNNFAVNPDVETLWQRYENYLNGREQLLSMGYFCLSFLENLAGGRRDLIVSKYLIERMVLDKLGDLTSAKGDHLTARKGIGHNFQPITQQEKVWIEECVKKIIHRVGEYQKDPSSLTMITMSCLPIL